MATELAEFTNLCMIYDGQGKILVQDRLDPSWPGICFPGGHVEPGESFTQSVIREVWEETGLTIQNPKLCGVKQFQSSKGARYVVFFYITNQFSGSLRSSEEGEVFWISKEELKTRPLVTDFMEMLQVFENDDLNEFYYYMDNGEWKLKLL